MLGHMIMRMGEGDISVLFQSLNSAASALLQILPREDETQQTQDILNPPNILRQEQTQEQEQYNAPDLAPRPGM